MVVFMAIQSLPRFGFHLKLFPIRFHLPQLPLIRKLPDEHPDTFPIEVPLLSLGRHLNILTRLTSPVSARNLSASPGPDGKSCPDRSSNPPMDSRYSNARASR